MGGANNICSDKTGTLTMNKMTLTQIWNCGIKLVDTYKDEY
jgi:P-type E1-E2 ATPase